MRSRCNHGYAAENGSGAPALNTQAVLLKATEDTVIASAGAAAGQLKLHRQQFIWVGNHHCSAGLRMAAAFYVWATKLNPQASTQSIPCTQPCYLLTQTSLIPISATHNKNLHVPLPALRCTPPCATCHPYQIKTSPCTQPCYFLTQPSLFPISATHNKKCTPARFQMYHTSRYLPP